MQASKKLATYEDLLTLLAGMRAEVIGGVLVKPPAAPSTATTAAAAGGYFRESASV